MMCFAVARAAAPAVRGGPPDDVLGVLPDATPTRCVLRARAVAERAFARVDAFHWDCVFDGQRGEFLLLPEGAG